MEKILCCNRRVIRVRAMLKLCWWRAGKQSLEAAFLDAPSNSRQGLLTIEADCLAAEHTSTTHWHKIHISPRHSKLALQQSTKSV